MSRHTELYCGMIVTIDIPENVVDEAKARGISVETLVREKIEAVPKSDSEEFPGLMRLGPGSMTPAEAGARIRELRKSVTLDGITVKELIEHGRRH